MTETQRRIRAYKKALPELRERVIAVAVLLAMSASMLGTASFAWITLSTAPEASGMATTVAANGNLEIALAQGDSMTGGMPIPAEEPDESMVGDSSVIQGILNSNNTWGNLINLSEPEYGVSNIALRPALLNNMNLNIAPLYGAMYGGDGRVVNTSVNYGYASWQDIGHGVWSFAAGDKTKYGVRAISTLTYDKEVGNAILEEYVTASRSAYQEAEVAYQKLIDPSYSGAYQLAGGRNCIQALEGLVGIFAQDKINDMEVSYMGITMELWPDDVERGTKNNCSPYIYNAYEMLVIMRDILLLEGEGLRQLANRQAYTNTETGQTPNPNTYDCVVADQGGTNPLLKYTDSQLKAKNISLATYNEFRTDYNKIVTCINNLLNNTKIVEAGGIERFKNPDDNTLPVIHYEDISSFVNELANINTTTINDTPLASFGGSAAVSLITGGNASVVIQAGIIPRFELRAISGQSLRINESVQVSVRTRKNILISSGSLTVKGTVQTASYGKGDGTYLKQFASLGSGGFAGIGDAVAQDTYGMAIDLWVRTNYTNAVLTLEGSVLTEKVHAQDASGNYLYTMKVEDRTVDIYKKTLSANTYYYVEDNQEIPEEELQTPEIVYTEVIIGYEGENRVWSEEALATMAEKGFLEKDPTTQGSGSCFVFYADSQSEQAKLLEMLESFTVAFIDASGNKLATAKLNTAKAFKNQGRVSVPMEVSDSKVTYEEKNDIGEVLEKKGIMQMVQNQPARITAIVYLDGTNLQNQNVLAAGELSGQLNIQFGTNALLLPPADQELQREYRTITASAVSDDGQTWPTSGSGENVIAYDKYTAAGHDITVNLEVDGVQPDKISGFFVRVINDTQGARMETQEFTPVAVAAEDGEDTVWTATFHLTDPGRYVLSDLLVNGMQYHLADGNHPTVTIPGLSLGTVTTLPSRTYMTAEKTYPVEVTAAILSEMGTANNVTVHFYEKGNISNQVITGMEQITNTNNWKAEVIFTKSATYVLDSITVDGRSLDVPNKTELTFRLGMWCEVYNNHPDGADTFIYENEAVTIPVTAKIWDDGRNPVVGESGVELNYSIGKSSINLTTAEMTWDPAGYYTGELTLPSPETYRFNSLKIGDKGSVSNANASPTFKLNPKDPPKFVSVSAPETQLAFTTNTPAVMQANIANATNATVWAEMKNGATTRYVQGVRDTGNNFVFTFNTDDGDDRNDLGDGVWTLRGLYAQDFTHADGTYYPATDPNNGEDPGFALTGVTPVETRIIKTDLKVSAVMDENEFHGTFMAQHSPRVTVTVTDLTGKELDGVSVSGGSWNVIHTEGTQLDYGGYTGNYGSGRYTDADTPKTGRPISNGAASIDDLRTAGAYTSTLTVELMADNGTASYVSGGPSFTVYSELPTVTVSAVSSNVTDNSKTDYSATVGFEQGSHKTCGTTYTDYYQSSVTLSLGNCGSASGGTMTFAAANGGTVHLYTEDESSGSQTTSFAWTGAGTSTRYVGLVANANKSNGTKTAAGTLTAESLVLTYGTDTFTFTVSKLTNNATASITIINN